MVNDQIVRAHCNSCLKGTNHVLVAEKKVSWSEEDWNGEILGEDSYQIVTCCGCDTVRFRRVSTGSEIYDEKYDFMEVIAYFPAAVSRQKPDWLSSLSDHEDIQSLLNEI